MAKDRRARLGCEPLEDRLAPAGGLELSGVEFRTLGGSGNNLDNSTQGAANTHIIRFNYPASYPDDLGNVIDVPGRPNARTISNAILAQQGSVLNDRHLTDWIFQWGQFITHDMELTISGPKWNVLSTGAVGNFRIAVTDPNDPLGPNPIPFNRSEFDPTSGFLSSNPRQQINHVTSYIDASMVYGSDTVRAAALRTFEGGKLKTAANGLLPEVNDEGLANDDPFHLGAQLFLAGDQRANEQVGLTATHALFVREHNRLATRLQLLYPNLTDEEVYQLARRIVGAEMQIITYKEYLPALLGSAAAPKPQDAVYNPDPELDASITSSFAAAIFRFGHSQVSERTLLVNNRNQTVGSLDIAEAFFKPDFFKNDPRNVELVLKGLASQLGQETDLLIVNGIRNQLFGPPGAGGLDLAALDIQRGRDHGVPNYNSLRQSYGLSTVSSFTQISSDPAIQAKLQELYGSVNNIDALVGALAEDRLPGSSVGALVNQIVVNQFTRLRDGDRFFYTDDTLLASPEVKQIIDLNEVSLGQIIRWNTGITHLQDDVFFFEEPVLVPEEPDPGAETPPSTPKPPIETLSMTPTSTSVTTSVNASLAGQPVTFTAYVADRVGGSPTGTVVFLDGNNHIAEVGLTPGSDPFTSAAQWTAPSFSVGSHTITVIYSGSATAQSSVSPPLIHRVVHTPNESFVILLYHDVLERTPAEEEVVYWSTQVNAGFSRSQVTASFWTSTEHRGRQVDGFYATYLHRAAEPGGRAYWVGRLRVGVSETDVTRLFLTSAEYAASHLFLPSYLEGLYADVLGRTADAAGLAYWRLVGRSDPSREILVQEFLSSEEAQRRLVTRSFADFFGRPASSGDWQFWLEVIRTQQTTPLALAITFLSSDEYRQRAIAQWGR